MSSSFALKLKCLCSHGSILLNLVSNSKAEWLWRPFSPGARTNCFAFCFAITAERFQFMVIEYFVLSTLSTILLTGVLSKSLIFFTLVYKIKHCLKCVILLHENDFHIQAKKRISSRQFSYSYSTETPKSKVRYRLLNFLQLDTTCVTSQVTTRGRSNLERLAASNSPNVKSQEGRFDSSLPNPSLPA